MKNKAILEIKDLHVSYGNIQALHGVSLAINQGEVVALIGSNGAGKSTLLMSIFGLPSPKSGEITFNQTTNLIGIPTHRISQYGIALVPEGRRIFPNMTVLENLKMGTIASGNEHEHEDLEKVFKIFPRLLERKAQSAGTLSGGEQQMLAIGRALMARPKLLFLDEPSLGLAPIIVKQIFKTIKEIANLGTTVFLVEQNANHALKLSDRAYVLVNGRITMSGTGEDLLNDPKVREAYLGH